MKCALCREPSKGLMCPICGKSWDRWHSRPNSTDDGTMWAVIAWVAARVWKLSKANERQQTERIRMLREENARLARVLWAADYALFLRVGLVGMTDPVQKARTLEGLKARALISW
jgi:hypothetical protein